LPLGVQSIQPIGPTGPIGLVLLVLSVRSDPMSIENRKSKIENLLVVGGSGYVGNLVLPLMTDQFRITIFDQNPPPFNIQHSTFNSGDVTDPTALESAARGMDLLLYMAMGRSIADPISSYDVNVKGLHLAMEAAVKAGIKR